MSNSGAAGTESKAQIIKQLDELQHFTAGLLTSLQNDQDKIVGEQVKEHIEAVKAKMDEEEKKKWEEDHEYDRVSDILIG